MFSLLKEALQSPSHARARPDVARETSTDSLSTAITVDAASNAPLSPSSTPPTSVEDSVSLSSESLSFEKTDPAPANGSPKRSQRRRKDVDTYNIKVMSGTAIHTPRKFARGSEEEAELEARHRAVSGDTLGGALSSRNSSSSTIKKQPRRRVSEGIEDLVSNYAAKKASKLQSQISIGGSPELSAKLRGPPPLRMTRSTGQKPESLTSKISVLGKRSRKTFEDGILKAKRELRNLADTLEFAHIDTRPVVHEVWSNGKLVTNEPPKKKVKTEQVALAQTDAGETKQEKKKSKGRKEKLWLNKGIYAGQDASDLDWFAKTSKRPKDFVPPSRTGVFMPLPMWHGQRMLNTGRSFKLPFDVCSPLPPGQPKPDEWRKTSSNRFVGEAGALWKKSNLFDSFSSKCICSSEIGCDEDCQNRIMLYECDDSNCGAGKEHCNNRAFSDLQERRKGGGKYRIGVEVIKTADRGHGVRTNRCFEPHQIIVEYTGEIITEDECDRRMNEDYKDNDCYYLMSFDQNMIIDATKGSIARFVNHSCSPNCRMVKWIVGGKPRMALFAGDQPITTGEELTYDYNFDPFSSKNVQECRCGSENCRGVLGPRPKDQKPIKETIKDVVKATVKAGKRKLKEFLRVDEIDEAEEAKPRSAKGLKLAAVKGSRKLAASADVMIVKSASKITKSKFSSQLLRARQSVGKTQGKTFSVKKTVKVSRLKTYGKTQATLSSRNSSLTLVATKSNSLKGKQIKSRLPKNKTTKKAEGSIRGSKKVESNRGASGSTIRVIAAAGEE